MGKLPKLTAAEKQRKYREKRKQNQDTHNTKSCSRVISNCSLVITLMFTFIVFLKNKIVIGSSEVVLLMKIFHSVTWFPLCYSMEISLQKIV
jgi:hypothetical protein